MGSQLDSLEVASRGLRSTASADIETTTAYNNSQSYSRRPRRPSFRILLSLETKATPYLFVTPTRDCHSLFPFMRKVRYKHCHSGLIFNIPDFLTWASRRVGPARECPCPHYGISPHLIKVMSNPRLLFRIPKA